MVINKGKITNHDNSGTVGDGLGDEVTGGKVTSESTMFIHMSKFWSQ